MYKHIILLLCFGLILGLDNDWADYEGHEISLNSIIIKIDDNVAPKLGIENPLTMNQVFELRDLDQNNFKNFEPLFNHYNSFSELHYEHNLHLYYRLSFHNKEHDLINLISAIKDIPMVEAVEFNYKMTAFLVPNDSYYQDQWALNNTGQAVSYNGGLVGTPGCDVDAERAWDITTGNSNVIIAILDTGIDLDHPDLQSGIIGG